MLKSLAYIFFLPYLLPGVLFGQQQQFNLSHYTMEDGLAHNHCYSISQDEFGFLWVATENGLSRFDGHEFVNYRFEEQDTTSIGGNWVRSLMCDKDNQLWVGNMRGGFNRYLPKTDGFKRLDPISVDSFGLATKELTKIYCDSDGCIWFGTFREGFGKYDTETKKISNYSFGNSFTSPRQAWSENSVFSIIEDINNPNILWVARKSELYRFDKQAEEFKLQTSFEPAEKHLSSIHDLYMEKSGELWVGFWGSGLAKYNIAEDTWQHYLYDPSKFREGDGYSNVCLDIERKSDHEFWLASGLDGLGIFDLQTESFKFIELPNAYDPKEKSGFAYDVFLDQNQGIWICDQINGLYHIDPSRQLFKHISTKIQQKGSRKGLNRPLDFAFDPESKKYYVATGQGDGLYIYDKNFQLITTAPSSLPSQYSYQQFVDVHIDKKSRIWVIDWLQNKLLRYDSTKNLCLPVALEKFDTYPEKDFNLSEITEDEKGNLWISTYYGGLIKYNPDQNVFQRFAGTDPSMELTDKAQTEAIHIAKDGRIWLGTLNYGIYIFDPYDETFSIYPYYGISDKGLIEDRVHGISQDKEGNIWVGFYTKGIQIINPQKGPEQKKIPLNINNALSNEQILDIEADLNHDMWVQTQGGVFKYQYKSGKFRLFTQKEGLKGYLKPAGFKVVKNGFLCVGGSEGFYVIQPGQRYINKKRPKVRLTGFEVGGENYSLNERIDFIDQIELPFRDNFFTLSFSALSFQLPEKNKYAYKLNGVDQDWVESGVPSKARYTNIREGQYLFEVRACNNDGFWSEVPATILIKINPPWYRSSLAYFSYFLLSVFLLAFVLWYQRKRWQLKTALQVKAEEARQLKELDRVKSRIYTNITHEFRTPLTVIQGMVEQINKNPTENLKDRIRIIKRNSKSLLLLINQMLELSKLEGGYIKLNLVHDDITKYLGYLTESFLSYANDKGIHLNFHAEQAPIHMDYDPEKIERIIGNLISNALKFTQEYGKVMVIARIVEQNHKNYLKLEVKDNGIGISDDDLKNIFDRFFQSDDSGTRKKGGTGIGLALVNELVRMLKGWVEVKSELGKGSSFSIFLPVNHSVEEKHLIYVEEETSKNAAYNDKKEQAVLASDQSEKAKLLIIEDNEDVIYYLESILKKNFQVTRARNGIEGVERALEIVPDIIISDVMMPGMDGFEVCTTLKNNELTSHIPIVILTAKASGEDRISGLKKGADAYLMKPFSEEELQIRLAKLIEIRKQIKDHYSSYYKHKKVLNKETDAEAAFIEKLNKLIENHLGEEHFDTMRLCQKIGMSRSQLHRKTKALLDTTPALYIRLLRLERSKYLLNNSDKTISEIAYETGFKSPSYFTYSFTETYGVSPSAFREME